MDTPIFERDGEQVAATRLAQGPWDEGACHGGAPAALLAALVDATPAPVPMQTVRLTFDIQRPVPVGVPLRPSVDVVRDGRRVQVLGVSLRRTDDDVELVHCRALRLRTGAVPVPADAAPLEAAPEPAPEALPRFAGVDGFPAVGFWEAVDVRFVAGELSRPGTGTAWFRVVAPLCAELELTPAARAAAAADFGNGIGSPLPKDTYLFVNPDLSVDLHRLPAGEWVAMRSTSTAQPTGIGLTRSELFDRAGPIGVATQSLFVDAAAPASG